MIASLEMWTLLHGSLAPPKDPHDRRTLTVVQADVWTDGRGSYALMFGQAFSAALRGGNGASIVSPETHCISLLFLIASCY